MDSHCPCFGVPRNQCRSTAIRSPPLSVLRYYTLRLVLDCTLWSWIFRASWGVVSYIYLTKTAHYSSGNLRLVMEFPSVGRVVGGHEIPWDGRPTAIPVGSRVKFRRNSHGTPWYTTVYQGTPWSSRRIPRGRLRLPTLYRGRPWVSVGRPTDSRRVSWKSHRFPSAPTRPHEDFPGSHGNKPNTMSIASVWVAKMRVGYELAQAYRPKLCQSRMPHAITTRRSHTPECLVSY